MSLLTRRRLLKKLMTRKEELPDGYLPLEYIEATGIQYIKTNIISGYELDMDIEFSDVNKRLLMGHAFYGASYFGKNTSNLYEIGDDITINDVDATQRRVVHVSRPTTSKILITAEGKTITRNEDGGVILPFVIFGGVSDNYNCYAKLYRATFTLNNGTVYDFIPAYFLKDDTAGLYDLVSGTFYTNSGTGDFLYKFKLPDEYIPLDYIQSTGTQYINTRIIPNKNQKIHINCYISEDFIQNNKVLFGSRTTGTYSSSKDQIYLNEVGECYIYAGIPKTNITSFIKDRHFDMTFDLKNGKIINEFNGETRTLNIAGYNNNSAYPYYIFSINAIGKSSSYTKGFLYQFSIWDNDKLVQYLVPCINPQGEVGMFDLVTQSFFGNAGSNSFLASPTTQEV